MSVDIKLKTYLQLKIRSKTTVPFFAAHDIKSGMVQLCRKIRRFPVIGTPAVTETRVAGHSSQALTEMASENRLVKIHWSER